MRVLLQLLALRAPVHHLRQGLKDLPRRVGFLQLRLGSALPMRPLLPCRSPRGVLRREKAVQHVERKAPSFWSMMNQTYEAANLPRNAMSMVET